MSGCGYLQDLAELRALGIEPAEYHHVRERTRMPSPPLRSVSTR